MRTHIGFHATVLTLCLAAAAAAAFAGAPPAAPPTPSAPPALGDRAPSAVDAGDAALQPSMQAAQARMNAWQRRDAAEQKQQAALQARMDAARRRMEVAAQQLAALSAQMYGPMMQRAETFGGPPRALIGVQLDDSGGDAGARVREVSPGGPAEEAGVRAGDVIVAVDGANVRGHGPAGRVVALLHDVKPGDKVDLQVLRDGKTRHLSVTARPGRYGLFIAPQLADADWPPVPRIRAVARWGGAPMLIGGPVADMELARLTPGLGRYFGTDTGVLVVRAPPKGALGLQDGDVILSIGGRKPIDGAHVVRILGSYDPGEAITLDVLRLHHRMSVATTVPAAPRLPRPVIMMRQGMVPGAGPVIRAGGNDGNL